MIFFTQIPRISQIKIQSLNLFQNYILSFNQHLITVSENSRMYIFGKNNNHLIKNNYKTTFSLPQKIRLIHQEIIKCACGHDFIICLTKQLKPYCYFQSAVYNIQFNEQEKIVDIATQQNLILFVTQKGQLYGTQFIAEKLLNDALKPKIIRLNIKFFQSNQNYIQQAKMLNDVIFLKMKNNLILHLKKNDWMETKSFSDPQTLYSSRNTNISDIVGSNNIFYFLTSEGTLLSSARSQLNSKANKIQIKQKLRKIVSSQSQIYAISDEGAIVRLHIKNNKAKCQKLSKIAANFVDLIVSKDNYYGITQDKEAWVWGRNAHGQLGLSDYEPRNTPYPLASLQKFYIKHFFTGQNYVCCLIDQSRVRQAVKISQRSLSVRSPIREVNTLINQNPHFQQYRDSFNQTESFVMPIRYTDDQSKISSRNDQNESYQQVNIIVNKKKNIQMNKINNNDDKNQKDKRKKHNLSDQRSSSRSKIQSKVQRKKTPGYSEFKSKENSVASQSKLTPKSVNRQRSLFKQKKQKISEYYVSTVSDTKSNQKCHKKGAIVSFKTPNKTSEQIQNFLRQKIQRELEVRYGLEMQNRQSKLNQRMDSMMALHKIEKQQFQDHIRSLQIQLKNKSQENKDLFDLITHKNLTIQDVTTKIQLLEAAIEQHEKNLTERDNQAEQFFLREKEYQLHIQKLQNQVQKIMEVLNYNERNRQTQIYKKEMERLSTEIKEKIDGEKQYYRERIKSLQRKFEQEKNLYELQIRSLQDQLKQYKQKQSHLVARINSQNQQKNIKISTPFVQNNSSGCMQSPTFHRLDKKHNINKKVEENPGMQESQLTLNDHIQERQTLPLKQSNRQNTCFSPFQKNKNQVKTKKNSRVFNNTPEIDESQMQNLLNNKSESQVKQIIQRIQKNKSCISKSANKLFNLLQNQKN